jgi:ergothioneine biosynthesis protein EgtB
MNSAAESPSTRIAGLITIRSYSAIRAATLDLCAPLTAEDCQVQSMPDVSPTKWHLAHTTWFFETFVLERWQEQFQPFQSEYRFLFNSYYQTVGEQYPRPQRGLLSRPPLEEVLKYRAHVDAAVVDLVERRAGDVDFESVVVLGLHHEQQHQELILTDIKHVLSHSPICPSYAPPVETAPAVAPRRPWLSFDDGLRYIGYEGTKFSFDNERPRHQYYVEPFELAAQPVSNDEFAAFIADGGYRRPDLWLSDGWATVVTEHWRAPLYWEKTGTAWEQFTLRGKLPVRGDEPVCHLSCYEADAYARWAGARLPTEQEWEVAAEGVAIEGNFVESRVFHPRASLSAAMPGQLYGDVWEWTASPYTAYPRYQPPAGALGEYNGKFMCNQFVLRGGSCATPQSHIRPTYRNFFPPAARWQFSGLRLARNRY